LYFSPSVLSRPWTFPAILGPQLVLLATLRSVLHEALPGYTVASGWDLRMGFAKTEDPKNCGITLW
jgi:hypothetical protein